MPEDKDQASQKGAVSHAPYCPQSEQCLCQTQITQANRVRGADIDKALNDLRRTVNAILNRPLDNVRPWSAGVRPEVPESEYERMIGAFVIKWMNKISNVEWRAIRARLADQKEG